MLVLQRRAACSTFYRRHIICQRFFANKPTQKSPVQEYDSKVKSGVLKSDPNQRRVLSELMTVYDSLLHYERKKPESNWWNVFSKASAHTKDDTPHGIYMHGDVGCGKTMLMDLFYSTIPSHLKKTRIHFHAFMQDIHKRLHELKAESSKYGASQDPVLRITHEISSSCDVLCLDEMQVTDIADAMILRHLFVSLYDDGVVTFFTSNRPPNDLYMEGVQRVSFIPCIQLIEEMNHVVYLESPIDYRKLPRPSSGCYFVGDTSSDAAKKHADTWFKYFSDGKEATTKRNLQIWGRPVPIPKSAGDNVMQFTFMELCGTARSAADYLELCRSFKCAVIVDIPELSLEQKDLVRRFITFLDAAYDSHIKLAVTVAKPFDQLFSTKHLRIDPNTNQVILQGSSGSSEEIIEPKNFPGNEEMFAFARALSRLKQMSSQVWLDFKRE